MGVQNPNDAAFSELFKAATRPSDGPFWQLLNGFDTSLGCRLAARLGTDYCCASGREGLSTDAVVGRITSDGVEKQVCATIHLRLSFVMSIRMPASRGRSTESTQRVSDWTQEPA